MKQRQSFNATFRCKLDLLGVTSDVAIAGLTNYIEKLTAFKLTKPIQHIADQDRIDGEVHYGGETGVLGASIDDVKKMVLKAFGKDLHKLSQSQKHDIWATRDEPSVKDHP